MGQRTFYVITHVKCQHGQFYSVVFWFILLEKYANENNYILNSAPENTGNMITESTVGDGGLGGGALEDTVHLFLSADLYQFNKATHVTG